MSMLVHCLGFRYPKLGGSACMSMPEHCEHVRAALSVALSIALGVGLCVYMRRREEISKSHAHGDM